MLLVRASNVNIFEEQAEVSCKDIYFAVIKKPPNIINENTAIAAFMSKGTPFSLKRSRVAS